MPWVRTQGEITFPPEAIFEFDAIPKLDSVQVQEK
jgi:hypothetical protein